MAFNLHELEMAVEQHGRIARILVVETSGSAPRPAGTAMTVWKEGQSGTIGGGALEFEATATARRALEADQPGIQAIRKPLGPGLGQCCGGSVTLVTELFDRAAVQATRSCIGDSDCYLRPAAPAAGNRPAAITRALAENPGRLCYSAGWIAEPADQRKRPLWLFGAGHVGRAVVAMLDPLGEFGIVWVDVSADRFPPDMPGGIEQLIAANPADVIRYAPADADHLVMTFSHALDLEICGRLLGIPFRSVGLIGSGTKWARFRRRLIDAGHDDELVDRIQCPIGMPELGKHPHAIAIGLACRLLGAAAPGPSLAEDGP